MCFRGWWNSSFRFKNHLYRDRQQKIENSYGTAGADLSITASRWITATSICAKEESTRVTVPLVNQRNFATVPGQFYDLIQWMREGCGRERANEDSGENTRPSLARPYIGCTPRDEFPACIAADIVTARVKNLCGRLRELVV